MPAPSRRRFLHGSLALAGLGLWGGCKLPRLVGEPPPRTSRIGWLSSPPRQSIPAFEAFRQGLHELGYIEGRDIVVEARHAERDDRLPDLAAELVTLPVDILVSGGSQVSPVAKQATATIPIVMAHGGDPIATGLVASLARPGANITGLTSIAPQMTTKRLDLLKPAAPSLSRVAVLWSPVNPAKPPEFLQAQGAAAALGLKLESFEVRGPGDFDGAFQAVTRESTDGLLVLAESVVVSELARVAEFATQSRLRSICELREFADAGGLMSYGANIRAIRVGAATYVDKILKGAQPADLPVEQPTTFDFVINLKTAQALGLSIPPSVLQQATEIIQ